MSTLLIELPSEVTERIAEQAKQSQMTTEQFAASELRRLFSDRDSDLDRTMNEILADNAELYRRLA